MDTSSTRFSLFIFLLTILVKTNNASPTPGLFGLDKVLHGTQYETNAEPEKIKLLLFTKNDKGAERNYTDVTEIKELEKRFNGSLPFIIILHGFMGSPHAKSTQYLIQGYVERGDYNVIGVDWKDIAKGPWYGVAASGTYSAAEQLADWMNDTINANLTTWKNLHILGFSLGAQVAGLTKKYIRSGSRVGRLVALDPARPNFDDKPPEDRLDAEDSDFTIVLHTCGGFLAVTDPVGHIDIYPNGGESPQPPCQDEVLHNLMHRYGDPSSPVLVMASKEPTKIFASLVCSHYMALVLWLEAISSEVRMIAKQCPSWEDYVNNQCNSSTNYSSSNHIEIIVGETTPISARGIYYIKTEEEVSYGSILYELIADGIREYSKLLGTDHVPHDTHDTDKGHGEVKEITPTVTTIDDSENKIEGSSSSSRTVINIYLVTIILVLLHRLR